MAHLVNDVGLGEEAFMAKWTANDIPDLGDKTAVVTGANSGLGYETAVGAGTTRPR